MAFSNALISMSDARSHLNNASPIYSLPPELIDQICQILADDHQSEYGVEHENEDPNGYNPFVIMQIPVSAPALHALAATSRYMNSRARPILYNAITISSYSQYRLLTASILSSPDGAEYVKRITFIEPVEISSSPDQEVEEVGNLVWEIMQLGWIQQGVDDPVARDAAVELWSLLLLLPNLVYIGYIGLRATDNERRHLDFLELHPAQVQGPPLSPFQEYFARALYKLADSRILSANNSWGLSESLVEVQLCGFIVYYWPMVLALILHLPALRKLSVTSPADLWEYDFRPLKAFSTTLRELYFSSSIITAENFLGVLKAIQRLETLHWAFRCPVAPFGEYMTATDGHRRSLQRLCITTELGLSTLLSPQSWSSYTALKELTLPETLMFDDRTVIEDLLLRLPPGIESLTVAIWHYKRSATGLMKPLAIQSCRIPTLREVTVYERARTSSQLEEELESVAPEFLLRGLRFQYRTRSDCTCEECQFVYYP
ncbi:hypothetical protein BJX76DRAFT_355059 [Aspergillus varians]